MTTVVVLSILVLLLLLSLIAQSGFNLSPLVMPESASETLLLYALTTLNFLAFVTVLFVLLRNVLKLVRERRANRLGSMFMSRLVSYAIGLSLLPVLLLFFFAFGLLNRSIDRWFGEPARQIVDDARNIEESYFKKEQDELVGIARVIARNLPADSGKPIADLKPEQRPSGKPIAESELGQRLRSEMVEYGVALARVVGPGAARLTVKTDDTLKVEEIEETLDAAEQNVLAGNEAFTGSDEAASPTSIYLVAAIPITTGPAGRALVLAQEYPKELTERTLHISEQHERFHSLLGKIKRIKSIYILLLAAVTLLLIFSATWLALYVARGITVPIQALAEATDRIARGDFSRPVEAAADDELAALVNSFNYMSAMLAENRSRLERAADDLERSNLAVEDRRRYLETVLESLSTGVVSTDSDLKIAFVNRSALWMLGLNEKPPVGTPIADLIPGRNADDLAALCRRARRTDSSHAELEITRADGRSLVTATTAIALRSSEGAVEGWVIVIEDLTDLIQAERAAAWSEVARRMAHEIKNPLTPIQLSAERILKNYTRVTPTQDSRFDQVVREGTSTIVREVAALQRMVEEFSRFARLPESKPAQTRLNDVITAALNLYTDRLNGITLDAYLADDMPTLLIDSEQMKRVLVNLIDNAIESLETDSQNGGNGSRAARRITVESRYKKESRSVLIVVSDNGHGIRPRDRDKLFLPKFSTRERGTGLGLAIVSHIVADHKGRIWFEDNVPRGARFLIELPVTRLE